MPRHKTKKFQGIYTETGYDVIIINSRGGGVANALGCPPPGAHDQLNIRVIEAKYLNRRFVLVLALMQLENVLFRQDLALRMQPLPQLKNPIVHPLEKYSRRLWY